MNTGESNCSDCGHELCCCDDDDYLRQHPAHELSLWQDWVQVVCRQLGMPPPTGREWDALMKTWHHGKAPLESADELALMRKTPNAGNNAPPKAVAVD